MTSWSDNPETICYCEIDECAKSHPATEIVPDRFAFQVVNHERESYYAAGVFADFVTEVRDLVDDEPATVTDLATGEIMDAVEFLDRFAAVAA